MTYLAARTLLARQERQTLSFCMIVAQRSKVCAQYRRLLAISRASPSHDWGLPIITVQSSIEAFRLASSPPRDLAHLLRDQATSANAVSTTDVEAASSILNDNVMDGDTEGETEGSLTARMEGSMSSDTHPPSIASEDESGMLDRLCSMGIGDQAVWATLCGWQTQLEVSRLRAGMMPNVSQHRKIRL